MAYKKKSWQDKMADKKDLPKILTLEPNFPCFKPAVKMGAKAGNKIILVNHSEVEEIMKAVPKGRLITLYEICKKLASKHQVAACCTLTTGIGTMTAANAAEEMRAEGKKNDTPYWRTLKADGFLNDKYPGGATAQKRLLEKEGFKVIQKGKRYRVLDYESHLTKP
jgi:alkylated DNA nucleotide flippase Atl1